MNKKIEFVFCVGLQSSASTWIFNVVCQMYRIYGKKTLSFYSEELNDVFSNIDDNCEICIVKSHSLDQNLIKFISCYKPKIIISTRELKDAISSMMKRFNSPFRDVPRDLSKSLCSLSCLDFDDALVLKYEHEFFKDPDLFYKISNFLDINIDVNFNINSFDFFSFENIRTMTAGDNYERNPDLYNKFLLHKNHVSDGAVDKWKCNLDSHQARSIDQALRSIDEIHQRIWPSGDIFFAMDFFHWNTEQISENEIFILPEGEMCIIWGPYFHIPKGRWRATYQIQVLEDVGRTRMRLDVVSGEKIVGMKEVAISNSLPDEFVVDFYHDDHFRPIELRIHSIDDRKVCRFKFSGVCLQIF